MPSEFAKQKARARLKDQKQTSSFYFEVPSGKPRVIHSPGKVSIDRIEIHTTEDCVFEVRDVFVEDSLYRVYLAGNNKWSLQPAYTEGDLELVFRSKTSQPPYVKLELDWRVL